MYDAHDLQQIGARMLKLKKLMVVLVVLVATIALLPGSALAAGETGWLTWGSPYGNENWTYCDYYPDASGNLGYWCYMPGAGTWKSISPNWQSGNGFAPGEFAD
jgi:hypothetical protein